ncbi:MAG: metallophosphoesterase [Candidatus Aminicenantes bacterium]|nr:metallophosphoesterase [Candidatus Aminicenantes bacterium]
MTSKNNTIKRIFISDIHMGDKRSTESGTPPPPYAYRWFRNIKKKNENRPQMLTDFLENHILKDETINEVIILGDLFDEWVVPPNMDPSEPPYPNQIEAVADAPQNRPVIKHLQTLATKGKLTYVTGNHDMLGTTKENKALIENILKGVKYIGDKGLGAYKTEDGIFAEHGHKYCLFNAPWANTGGSSGFAASILPLGFFLARLDAGYVAQKGEGFNFLEFLWDAIKRKHKSNFTEEKHETIAEEIDGIIIDAFKIFHSDKVFSGQDGVVLDGLGGIPGTVKWKEIEDRSARIFSQWKEYHPDNESAFHAALNDTGDLEIAAKFLFEQQQGKIVIFGHTHAWKFQKHCLEKGHHIYANTGAWVNKKPCTFVNTEFDTESREHTIGVWEYKDNKIKLLEDGSVNIETGSTPESSCLPCRIFKKITGLFR